MRQEREEPIRSFHGRIKEQADTCNYQMVCTRTGCDDQVVHDFTDEILRDVIARGIADTEIQLVLLGEKNQNMPLKDMFQYIDAKESAKRYKGRIRNSDRPRVRQRAVLEKPKAKEEPKAKLPKGACIQCGEVGHGEQPTWKTRRAECRAHGKTCGKCGRRHHFAGVCPDDGQSSWQKKKTEAPPAAAGT